MTYRGSIAITQPADYSVLCTDIQAMPFGAYTVIKLLTRWATFGSNLMKYDSLSDKNIFVKKINQQGPFTVIIAGNMFSFNIHEFIYYDMKLNGYKGDIMDEVVLGGSIRMKECARRYMSDYNDMCRVKNDFINLVINREPFTDICIIAVISS